MSTKSVTDNYIRKTYFEVNTEMDPAKTEYNAGNTIPFLPGGIHCFILNKGVKSFPSAFNLCPQNILKRQLGRR